MIRFPKTAQMEKHAHVIGRMKSFFRAGHGWPQQNIANRVQLMCHPLLRGSLSIGQRVNYELSLGTDPMAFHEEG
jgi:hypothetical protein